jgi:hypothetical protein
MNCRSIHNGATKLRIRRFNMKGISILFGCLLVLSSGHSYAAPKSDPRFFGTYCGDASFEECRTVTTKILGVTVDKRRVCVTVEIKDIEAKLDYTETVKGGLVHGSGKGTHDDEEVGFVFAGAVVGHGKARGSATAAGLKPCSALARLSNDGLALTIPYRGEDHILRKDACRNTPPQVTITQFPTVPIRYGRTHFFVGAVSDAEDLPSPASKFEPERLIWTYDDFGLLKKSPSGLRAWTKPTTTVTPAPIGVEGLGSALDLIGGIPLNPSFELAGKFVAIPIPPSLPPGNHKITFSATDSGGLTAKADVQVTVINDPPNITTILLPGEAHILSAGCDNNFLGQAYDVEDGFLTGNNLVWSSNLDGVIGHGTDLKKSLDTPGTHVIQLTASDSVGASSSAETTVSVQLSPGGCAPSARIVAPPYGQWVGPMVIVIGDKITFVGTAEDSEDLPDQLDLRWTRTEIHINGNPIGVPELLAPDSTSVVEDSEFSATGLYEITFTVTDTDGNARQDKMRVYVLGSPIL